MSKCNCLTDYDKRINFAAEVVTLLLTSSKFKSVPFELYSSHRQKDFRRLSFRDRKELVSFSEYFHKAVFSTHLQLFGSYCDIEDDILYEDFYVLVLECYCREKL